MTTHVKVLGWLFIVFGAFYILLAFASSMILGLLATIVGSQGGDDAVVGASILGFTGAAYGATKTGLAPLVESINDQEGRHGIRATLVCPGEVATPILRTRPVPPSEEEMARMLRPDDVADAIAYVVQAPAHVCLNEVVISPTWNRIYIGADDLKPR